MYIYILYIYIIYIYIIVCFILFIDKSILLKPFSWPFSLSVNLVNLSYSILVYTICFNVFFFLTCRANKIFGFLVRKQKGENFQRKGRRTIVE